MFLQRRSPRPSGRNVGAATESDGIARFRARIDHDARADASLDRDAPGSFAEAFRHITEL